MNREEWGTLIGHLRDELLHESKDPDHFLEDDFDAREILISNEANDESEWIAFDMNSEYDDGDLRNLAVRMVRRALGTS